MKTYRNHFGATAGFTLMCVLLFFMHEVGQKNIEHRALQQLRCLVDAKVETWLKVADEDKDLIGEFIENPTSFSRSIVGKTGEFYCLDGNGIMTAPSKFSAQHEIVTGQIFVQALRNTTFKGRYKNYRRKNVLGYSKAVTIFGKPYVLVAEKPMSEVKEIFPLWNYIILVSLSLFVCFFLILYFSFRRTIHDKWNQSIADAVESKRKMRVYHNAFESYPGGFVIANNQYEIEFVNSNFERIMGYTKKEIVGKSLFSIASNPTALKNTFTKLETERASLSFQNVQTVKKNGEAIQVEVEFYRTSRIRGKYYFIALILEEHQMDKYE